MTVLVKADWSVVLKENHLVGNWVVWMAYPMAACLDLCLVVLSVVYLAVTTAAHSVDGLVGWMAGWMVANLVGAMVVWKADSMVGQ